MKLFTTLLTSFLLFTAVLSGQAGMTVEIDNPCLGPAFSMTFIGTDATGRNIYGNESINGAGNPILSIFYDQASGSWVIGIPGSPNAGDRLFETGPNTFSPNPPDSTTEPFNETPALAGCGAATVSGTGTQDMAGGDPCAALGGDDDMDGVCNDNDVCPGFDDNADMDMDGIADGCDDNPMTFDGVSFDSPCLGGVIAFTLSGNDGTRNTYANAAQGLEIVFDATNNRWEMRGSGAGGAVIYFNTLATIPDPPSTVAMAWEGDPAGGCADVPTVSGTGAQDSRCTITVADCPDDGDPCTEAFLDADCNCTNVPVANVLPTAICNPTVTVELDMDGVATLAAADVDNGSADDACGSIATLTLDRSDFDCDDIDLSPITVTLMVTDNEGGMATCTAAITVEDNIAPTFTCTDITVDLDAAGEYFITDSDVFTRMVQDWDDNCAPAPVSFGSGTRLITCDNITNGTFFSYFFGARDGNGQETLCTSIITVNDPSMVCTFLPVEWLSFSANAGAKSVNLQWETTTEPDNAGFHIERSPDGNAWTVIAEQAPLESNLYLHVDEAPLTGQNYYRVRQTDFDGTVTFSPVEVVYFIGNLTKVSVAPNPMTDEFTVIVPEAFGENADLRLYDLNGRLIQLRMSATGSSGTRVETRDLTSGVYLLRATSQDGKQTQTVRVVRK